MHFRFAKVQLVHSNYGKLPRSREDALLLRKHPTIFPASAVARLPTRPAWRRGLRRTALQTPWRDDPVLRCLWLQRNRRYELVRLLSVRLLQWHRTLVWERAFRSGWQVPTQWWTESGAGFSSSLPGKCNCAQLHNCEVEESLTTAGQGFIM